MVVHFLLSYLAKAEIKQAFKKYVKHVLGLQTLNLIWVCQAVSCVKCELTANDFRVMLCFLVFSLHAICCEFEFVTNYAVFPVNTVNIVNHWPTKLEKPSKTHRC